MLLWLGQETVPNQFLTRQVTLPTRDRFAVAQHSSRSFPTGNCSAQVLRRLCVRACMRAGEDCYWPPALSSRETVFSIQTSPRSMLLSCPGHQPLKAGRHLFVLSNDLTFIHQNSAHTCENGLLFTACRQALGSYGCPASMGSSCSARGLQEAWKRSSRGAGFIITFFYHFPNNIEIRFGLKCSLLSSN